MKLKRIVNLILLIFVVITVATMVYKEFKEGRTENSKEESLSKTETSFVAPSSEKAREISSLKESEKNNINNIEEAQKKNETSLPQEKKLTETVVAPPANKEVKRETESVKSEQKVEPKVHEKLIVYYFMTTTRCPSCYKIENYTHSCILDRFADKLADGTMEWKMVNVDEKENAHFINDYQIFTKSVILSKISDGKEIEWKNLEKVWDLLSDQKEFYNYIETEIKNFLKDEK